MPLEVVAREPLSARVEVVRLRSRDPESFRWLPGQHVELSLPGSIAGAIPYSIASAPDPQRPGELELAVANSGSRDLLGKLKPQGAVFASRPRGSFIWRPGQGGSLLIGMGTGIAPLRAMLQAALQQSSEPIVLLFGNREEADILWRTELEALAAAAPRFHFLPTLSNAGLAWQGRRGRVQDHLDAVMQLAPDARVYVCGNPSMVGDTVGRLNTAFGIVPGRIWSEAY